MKTKLEAIKNAAMEEIKTINSPAAMEEFRVKYLGKKGELTAFFKMMGSLSPEERPVMGQLANEVRSAIDALITEKSADIKNAEKIK